MYYSETDWTTLNLVSRPKTALKIDNLSQVLFICIDILNSIETEVSLWLFKSSKTE